MVTHIDTFDCADRQNFEMLKVHDGGGCHSDKKNRKMARLTDRHHKTLSILPNKTANIIKIEMWANAQRHGRPAEYRWRPLFNAAKFG